MEVGVKNNILIVTDIFGYPNATEILKHRFESTCKTVHILDPYDAKPMNFHDEDEAYEAFNQLCGLENYAKACIEALDTLSNENIILIGFSMGASALWKALSGRKNAKIKHFFGFYASQIRHALEVKPHVPCTLIFPKYEKHFEVDTLIRELVKYENITCIKTEYLHGFMNPFSINYDAKAYAKHCQFLDEAIFAMRFEN